MAGKQTRVQMEMIVAGKINQLVSIYIAINGLFIVTGIYTSRLY